MKIIIDGKHTVELMAALDAEQKRCTVRTITALDIENVLESVAEKLDIPKASMKGVKVHYTGAEKLPSAYKYTPTSTHFTAEHNGRFWCVTSISRDICPNRHNNITVELTEAAKMAVVARLSNMEI